MVFLKKWMTRLWILLTVCFIAWFFWRYPEQIDMEFAYTIGVDKYLISLILIIIGKFLTIKLVFDTLRHSGCANDFSFAWWSYSSSDLAKYLPGGIWGITGRLYIYNNAGIPVKKASKIFLVESIILVSCATFTGLSISIYSFISPHLAIFFLTTITLGLLCFLIMKACLANFHLYKILNCQFEQTLAWVIFGSSFAVLCSSHLPEEQTISAAGIFNLSFVAGFAAFFAPSGIGVREAVIGYWAHISGIDLFQIMKIAVLHRAIWAIADLVVFIPIWSYSSGRKKTTP